MSNIRLGLIIALAILSSACGVGGFWMNGNPSVGKNIKPYISIWVKEGMTEERRRADSWACGAGPTGYGADNISFSDEQMRVERRPGERDNIVAYDRLRQKWRTCMEAKGYVPAGKMRGASDQK